MPVVPYPTARAYAAAMAAAALGSFLVLWAWIAFLPLAYLDPEYPFWRAKQELVRSCDLGDLIILGDSRATVGILPSHLPLRATNLAVGGGKPVEAMAILRRVLTCPTPPRFALISFDPGHFMKPDLFWERSVRFGWMDRADLRELAELSAATGDWSVHEARQTDGLPPAVRAALYGLRFPPYYFNSVLKSGGFLRWGTNRAGLAQGLAARGQYYFGTAPGSDGVALDAGLDAFAPAPVLDAMFHRVLARLAASGITAWFVPLPVNDATWQAMRPEVTAGFEAYLAAKALRHDRFAVRRVAEPHWPNQWFGDAFAHLNPAGAERLSRDLAACLTSWQAGDPDCPMVTRIADRASAAAGRAAENAE